MFNLTDTAFLTAGFGSVTIFWNQIKGFFSRISQYVVISVDLHGDCGPALVKYCWENFKFSRVGERRFTALQKFIKPKDKYGLVVFEMTGKGLTFFDGWKPLFIAVGMSKDGNPTNDVKLTFLRGTFDLNKLLHGAVEDFNAKNHDTQSTSSRYYVKKIFGAGDNTNYNKGNNQEGSLVANSDNPVSSHNSPDDLRPISWKKEEIGSPTNKEPFQSLAYDENIKEFEKEVRRWKGSEKWHKEKKLPWRFGAGLFGGPGTGKTSFVRAIAQDLDMPIHIYDLTTMTNAQLTAYWTNSLNSSPCVVLFEDMDRIFDKDQNIKTSKDNKGVTMDCLLNCINGVEQSNGILVFITANDPSKLDSALGVPDSAGKSSRPGRLDRAVFFGPLSEKSRFSIANRILSDCPEIIGETVKAGIGESGAQFESRCAQIALKKFWGDFKVYGDNQLSLSEGVSTQ